MTRGLPILAAERPYARSLCGDAAIYFDPSTAASLDAAIGELRRRLSMGWTPDYAERLALIPHDWDEVARRIIALFDENHPYSLPESSHAMKQLVAFDLHGTLAESKQPLPHGKGDGLANLPTAAHAAGISGGA